MRTMLLLALCCLAAASLPAQVRPVEHYRQITSPPPRSIERPDLERLVLDNGLVVYLLPDAELPLVGASAMIPVGSRWEPVAKAGLAELVGTVMRTGGTPMRNGDKLDEDLDSLGASIELFVAEDSATAMVSALKENSAMALEVLADLLPNPAFPQDKIDLAKVNQRDNVARRNDFPPMIGFREFARVLFGPDSAYGHQIEYATIDAISRDDLLTFHKQFVQPQNIVLAVWGDFGAEMKLCLQNSFGKWPRGSSPKPEVPPVNTSPATTAGYYLVKKNDVNQSWVLLGQLAGRRDSEDFPALDLMSQVLGGSFASRLFSNIRSAQGLAYAVSSAWDAGWDRPGTFMAFGATKSETTARILTAIQNEISSVIEKGVSESELARVKEAAAKSLAFEFDSTAKIARRQMRYEYYGYPSDFLERYQEGIAKVRRQDIQRVAREYLKPGQFAILVVGNDKEFDRPLSDFGPVKEVDISIPPGRIAP